MGISVIIAHYAPPINTEKYLNLLRDTITSIKNQKTDFNTEIILCDDGSNWSKGLLKGEGITEYLSTEIKGIPLLKELDINVYLGLPDVNKYRGIILKHRAFEIASNEKVVVLDDDHPFINHNSLSFYNNYLDKYEFVRGRLLGPWGRPQLFLSPNAQGTNYGIRKELYFKIGGFGKYLFDNGYGEDNDILWRVFSELSKSKIKKACWAGEIVTRDLATDRWADRAANNLVSEEVYFPYVNKRRASFIVDFKKEYGVHPFIKNPSRKKRIWVRLPSFNSKLSELYYLLVYTKYIPKIIFEKFKKIKKLDWMIIKEKLKIQNYLNILF